MIFKMIFHNMTCCCCKYFISYQKEYINDRSLHSISHNCDKIPCGQKLNRNKIKVKSLLCLMLWCDNQKGISAAVIITD